MRLGDVAEEVKSPEMGLWDGAEEVELPRCGFEMELWDEVSRGVVLRWSYGMKSPEKRLWDGAMGVKFPR